MTANATPLILRILCLHDNNSNAFDLQHEFHLLGKKLYKNHSIDLVYVNGPLIITTPDSTNDENQKYVWWEERHETCDADRNIVTGVVSSFAIRNSQCATKESECPNGLAENEQSNDSSTTQQAAQIEPPNRGIPTNPIIHYDGLDASLMLLRQIWTSCQFWGIMGIGKGAALAALFTTLLESERLSYHAATSKEDTSTTLPKLPLSPNLPQLIIFVSGESLLSVDEPLLVSNHFNTTPSPLILHLVDNDTSRVQDLLIRQFPQGSQVERREHFPSTRSKAFSKHDLNVIGRFICQRKKALYSSHNDETESSFDHNHQSNKILALQTALYNAEQDAASCIAETIALNPPAALMAVIRPQMVAGWKGNRRAQPEGGGAPCPEEFLHRKSKAVTNSQTESLS